MFFPSHTIELNICWDNLEPKNFYILCFLNQKTTYLLSLCKQFSNLSHCLHNSMCNPSLMTCLTFFCVLIKHLSPKLDTEFTEDGSNILLSFKPRATDTEMSFNKYMLEESVNLIVWEKWNHQLFVTIMELHNISAKSVHFLCF